jgi:hypothetical protein
MTYTMPGPQANRGTMAGRSGFGHAGQRRKESDGLPRVQDGNNQREEIPQRE